MMVPVIPAAAIAVADTLIGDSLRRQAAAQPDAPAFVTWTETLRPLRQARGIERRPDEPPTTWTYAEVDDAVNRIAQGLAGLGIGAGERVACLTRHGAECTLLLLAASRLGAVCAPVNWRLAAPEVQYVLGHAEARWLLCDAEFLPAIEGAALPLLKQVVVTDGPDASHAGFGEWLAAFPPEDPRQDGAPDAPALQLYSSGTTGLPKGVELTHRSLLIACRVYAEVFGIGPSSVMLNALPSFHIAGVENALTPLIEGGRVVFQPQYEPAAVIAAIQRHRVTHAFLVPAMIIFLLEHPDAKAADFSSLEGISYGGSPAAERLISEAQHRLGCRLLQSYGMTEATGTMTWLLPEDHDPDGPRRGLLRSAGTPAPGTEVRIVEPGGTADAAEGEVGEVWVRSLQNMHGYWRNPEATASAFPEGRDAAGGWMRTGDAGYAKDGYLYIHDRIKDMIISGGENIYPAEIENVLASHDAVLECAVIGVPDERWGEAVKACVVTKAGRAIGEAELIGWLRERLAHYKCPKSVDFVETLPRNPSGKLLKRTLREPYWKDRQRQVG